MAAVGARNLHLLATREGLGPLRGQEVAVGGSLPGLEWTLRFYDPVVTPALGLIAESEGPAYAEVRGALGEHGRLPRRRAAGLGADRRTTPGHVGAGLAAGHTAAARDFETIRSRVRGREALVDEMVGAVTRASPARRSCWPGRSPPATPPSSAGGRGAGRAASPDPDEVRKALLASVGGRSGWTPPAP